MHKTLRAVVTIVTLGVAAAACSTSNSSSGTAASKPPNKTVTIVMVQGVTGQPFAQITAQGGRDAATLVGGVKFSVAGPANIDPSTEAKIFQQVVSTKPSGIALQELPPDLFTRLVKDAQQSGITVLPYTIAPAVGSSATTFVGDNGLDLGRMAADRIADTLVKTKGANVSGEVVTGICVPGLSVLTQRLEGLKQQMGKRLPNVKVLDAFDSKADPAADFTVWQQATAAHPNALAMVSPCEADNQNLVKIKNSAHAKWLMTPFDLDDQILQGVKDGSVLAVFPQSSYLHGYVATRVLAESLKAGRTLASGWIKMPVVPVDSSNFSEIETRQASLENQRSFWKPYIEKIFTGSSVAALPLEQANK